MAQGIDVSTRRFNGARTAAHGRLPPNSTAIPDTSAAATVIIRVSFADL
jgi:hypothetical protein